MSLWLELAEMKEQVVAAAESLPAAASWPSACSSWPSWQRLEQLPVLLQPSAADESCQPVPHHPGSPAKSPTFGSVSTICLLHSYNLGIKACSLQVLYCVCTTHMFCQAKGPLMSTKVDDTMGLLTRQSREEGIAAGLAYARGWQEVVKHMLALIVRSDGCQKSITPESMLGSGAQSLHPVCWPDVGRQGTAGELLELWQHCTSCLGTGQPAVAARADYCTCFPGAPQQALHLLMQYTMPSVVAAQGQQVGLKRSMIASKCMGAGTKTHVQLFRVETS